MIVAVNARNPLVALLSAITDNVDLLFSFASGAFNDHDEILFGFHLRTRFVLQFDAIGCVPNRS